MSLAFIGFLLGTSLVLFLLRVVLGAVSDACLDRYDPAFRRRWSGERGDALGHLLLGVLAALVAAGAVVVSFTDHGSSAAGTLQVVAGVVAVGSLCAFWAARRSFWRAKHWE